MEGGELGSIGNIIRRNSTRKTRRYSSKRTNANDNAPEGFARLFLVEDELKKGELISIEGEHIKGTVRDIVIACLSEKTTGTMFDKLWSCF